MSVTHGRGLYVAFAAAIVCVAWSWIPLTISVPNEKTRVYLTMALVERGSLQVDEEVQRFGRVIDIAKQDGHYYTDKAPGTSFLGAPVYAAARAMRPGHERTAVEVLALLRRALMLPIALLGMIALRKLLLALGISEPSAALAALAWPLATTALHYAGALLGHHIVAVALVASLWLAVRARSAEGSRALLQFAGAGALAGVAGFVEYQAAPACVALGLWVLFEQRKRPLALAAFALGVAPLAAALLGYNNAAFGSPFALSYTHVATAGFASNHNHGIGGIDVPKLSALGGLLFSARRGWLVTTPIMWLALPGCVWLAKQHRALAIAIAAMLVLQVMVIAGFDGWWGGWAYGPRLLLPVLGPAFVALGCAFDALRARPWGVALVAALLLIGAVQSGLMQATFFEAPEELENPLYDVALPILERGLCAPSLGQLVFGFGRCGAIAPAALLALGVLGAAFYAWSREVAPRVRWLSLGVAALAVCAALALTRLAHRSPDAELERTMRFISVHQPPGS